SGRSGKYVSDSMKWVICILFRAGGPWIPAVKRVLSLSGHPRVKVQSWSVAEVCRLRCGTGLFNALRRSTRCKAVFPPAGFEPLAISLRRTQPASFTDGDFADPGQSR